MPNLANSSRLRPQNLVECGPPLLKSGKHWSTLPYLGRIRANFGRNRPSMVEPGEYLLPEFDQTQFQLGQRRAKFADQANIVQSGSIGSRFTPLPTNLVRCVQHVPSFVPAAPFYIREAAGPQDVGIETSAPSEAGRFAYSSCRSSAPWPPPPPLRLSMHPSLPNRRQLPAQPLPNIGQREGRDSVSLTGASGAREAIGGALGRWPRAGKLEVPLRVSANFIRM